MTATCIGQTLNGLGGGLSYFIANIFVSQNIDNQTGIQIKSLFDFLLENFYALCGGWGVEFILFP